MANNRTCCLIVSFAIFLVLLIIISSIIYIIRRNNTQVIDTREACPRPNQYITDYDFDYTKKGHEYRNTHSPVDYFRFSLSWSPTFCKQNMYAKSTFQCQHVFGFIVHGLWPSTKKTHASHGLNDLHPRNCRNEPPISLGIIKKHFCIMPSETLMQAEWEKHGTCYWKNPDDYFDKISALHSSLNFPANMAGILNDSPRLQRKIIQQSFVSINPQLKVDDIDVVIDTKSNQLKEIAFCYDRDFNHIACHRNM